MALHTTDAENIVNARRKAVVAIATKKLANIDKILYDDRFRIPPMAFFIERSKQKEKFINWLKNLAQENELNHHFATAMSSSAATEAYAAYRLYAQRDEILSFVATNYAVLDAVGKVTLDDLREAFNDIRNKKTKNTSLAIQRCQPLIDELMKPTTLSIGSSGQQAPKTISHDEIRQSSSATINSSVIADVVMPVLTWVEKKEQEIETATAALVAIIKKAAVALQEIYRKYPNFKPEQFEALSQNSEQGSVAIQEEFITTTIAMGSDYAEAKRLFLLINITKTKATKTETTVDTDPDYAEAKRLLNLIQDLKEEISKKMEDANKEFTQKTLQPMRQKIVDELTTLFQLPLAVVDQFVLLQGMLLSGAVFAPPCAVGEYNTFFSGYVSENWDVINKELYYNIATTMLVKAIDANKLNHAEFNTVGIACIRLLRSIIEGADYNFEGGRQDITYQAGNGNQTKAIPEELYNYYQELGDLETVKDGESTETTFMEKFVTKLLKWCDDFSEARMNSPMFQAIFSDNRDAYINHSKFLTLLRVWIEERNQNRHLEVSQIINKLFPGNELTQGVAAGFARMHQVKEALCYITKVNDTAAIETLEKTKEQNANAQYDFYWVPNASHKNGGTFYYYIDGVCEVELEDYQPLQLFLSNKGKNEMNKRIDVTSPEGYKIIQAVYVHRERIITDSRAMEQRAKQFYNKEPRSAATASTEGSQSGPSGSSMLPTEAARRQAELAEAALRRQRSGSLAASSSSDVSTTAAAVRKPAPQAAPALNRTESLPGMRRASPPKGDDATATPAARGRGRGGRGRGGRGIGQVHQGSMSMQLPPHAGADAAVHGGMQFQLPVVGSQPVILKSSQGPSTSAGSVARQDSKQLEHPVVASPSTSSSSSVDTTGSTEGRGPAPELPARRPSPPKDVEPSPATPVSSVSDTAAAGQQPQVPRRGPSMPAVERKIVPLHQQSVKVVRYEDWETTVAALESQKANTMAMSISNKTVYYAYCKEDGTCVSKSIAVGDNHILKNGYTCLSEKLLDLKGGFLGSNNPEFERKDSTWYNVYHMICSAERIKPHQSSPPRVNDNGASSSSAQGASSSKPAVRQRTPTMKFSLGAAEGSSQQPVVREKPVASEKPEHLRSALTQSGNSFAANPNGRGRGVPQPGRGRALPPQPGRGRGGQE